MTEQRDVRIAIDHITTGLDRVQQSIDEQKKLGAATGDLQAEFDDLKSALDSLDLQAALVDDLAKTERSLAAAQDKAATYASEQARLSAAVQAAGQAQAEAANEFAQAQDKVEGLDVAIRQHQANVASLKAEQEANKTALANARAEYGETSDEVAQLTARDRELAEAIANEKAAQAAASVERTQAKQTADDLKAELQEQNGALRDAEKALQANGKASEKAASDAERLESQVDSLRSELEGAGVDTSDLAGEQQRLAAELEAAGDAAEEFGNRVEDGLQDAQSASENSKLSIAGLGSAFGNLAANAITKATEALGSFVKGLGDAFAQNEKTERTMRLASGSAEDLAANLELVDKISTRLQFTDDALAESFARLKNAGLDPAAGSLEDVATIAKALGGEEQQLQVVTEILAESYQKGKVEAEAFNKAGRAQIPLLEAMAESMGISTDEVLRLGQQGKLTATDMERAYRTLREKMAGDAEAAASGWTGAINFIKSAYDDFVDFLTSSGLQGKVVEIFDGIRGNAEDTTETIKDLGVRAGGLLQAIIGPIDALAGTLRIAFNGVQAGFRGLILGFLEVAQGVAEFASNLPIVGDSAKRFAENVQASIDGLKDDIIQDGKDMQAGLVQVGRGMTTTLEGLGDTFKGLAGESENAGGKTASAFDQAAESLKGLRDTAGSTSTQIADGLAKLIASAKTVGDLKTAQAALDDQQIRTKLSADQLAAAQAALKQRMEDLDGTTERNRQRAADLEAAYKALGLTSLETLKRNATEAAQAFDLVSTEAGNSKERVADAYAVMAKASLEAAAAQGEAALKREAAELRVKAATEEQRDALDKLVQTYPALASSAKDATDTAAAGADKVTAANKRAVDSAGEGARQVSAFGGSVSEFFEGVANRVNSLSNKTFAAFSEIQREMVGQITTFIEWADATAAAADHVERLFNAQKKAQQSLLGQLQDADNVNAAFLRGAESATRQMHLLDDADLAQLRAAINDAREKMADLRREARRTRDDLRDELLTELGQDDLVQQREDARRFEELLGQRDAAERAGDQGAVADLDAALKDLERLIAAREEREKREQLESLDQQIEAAQRRLDDAKEAGDREGESAAQRALADLFAARQRTSREDGATDARNARTAGEQLLSTSGPQAGPRSFRDGEGGSGTAGAGSSRTITVNFTDGAGRPQSATLTDDSGGQAFLDQLDRAGQTGGF